MDFTQIDQFGKSRSDRKRKNARWADKNVVWQRRRQTHALLKARRKEKEISRKRKRKKTAADWESRQERDFWNGGHLKFNKMNTGNRKVGAERYTRRAKRALWSTGNESNRIQRSNNRQERSEIIQTKQGGWKDLKYDSITKMRQSKWIESRGWKRKEKLTFKREYQKKWRTIKLTVDVEYKLVEVRSARSSRTKRKELAKMLMRMQPRSDGHKSTTITAAPSEPALLNRKRCRKC